MIDVAGLASQLRLSVFRLSRKLRRQAEAGITQTQLAALSTIERHGPLTAGDLAAHEQIQKPTCTSVIAALLVESLIERAPGSRRTSWRPSSARRTSSSDSPKRTDDEPVPCLCPAHVPVLP